MASNYELEIFQQPEAMRNFLGTHAESIHRIAEACRSVNPKFVLIAARGTSDNAATYAKYLFGAFPGIPVALAMPSLYTLYDRRPDMREGLVIGISQSGESPDILAVLDEAKRQGALTLTITNKGNSPLTKMADHVIELGAGEEKSVAASKTYTAELLAIASLIAHWQADGQMLLDLERLPASADEVLKQKPAVEAVARRFYQQDHMVVVGRGMNHCTIFEIALKIKELSYIVAQAYSAADFKHGPIALLEEGFPVVGIAPRGKALDNMKSLIDEIKESKADLALISNDQGLLAQVELPIALPADLPEWLSPIIAVIPGQMLALHLALNKRYDPDKPRGLRKVTLTL